MFFVALLALKSPPSISDIDRFARAREVASLRALLAPMPAGARDPFKVIKTGGAYEVGRFGWKAAELTPEYVVIGTPLTSEDIGELLFKREGDNLKFIPEDDDLGVKVRHHSFLVDFHPSEKSVDIIDVVKFHADRPGSNFVFRMSPQYVVKRITDKAGANVPFNEAEGVVLLKRPSSGAFEYQVDYSAIVDAPRYSGAISSNEATLTNDYWYPMVARWPATYDITIHAPAGWTAVAQGEKLSQVDSPTSSVTKYRMDLPVTYYSVSAAPYKIVSQTFAGRRISCWSLRMSQAQMEEQPEYYAPILKFYEQFAPFPFSGYGAVDSAVYGGGALEAYSFATYGDGLPSEDAHEPSHTWWGGIMDNTYLHSFWNESFAVFCEGLYARNVPIGNHDERKAAFVRSGRGSSDYDSVAILDGGVDAGNVAGSLGYGKGSQVLQMLEQYVGTPKMILIMHDWIAGHEKGTPAEWPEFEATAERDAANLKLESFFADWLARPGYARLDANATYADGATVIDLTWNGPRFRMPLLVMLRSDSGVDTFTTVDTASGDHFRIAGPKPVLVSVDPYRQALRDVSDNENPPDLGTFQATTTLADPAHTDWNGATAASPTGPAAPADLVGATIIGSPETLPWMKPLCDRVGFRVSGNNLTYKGTTIDLRHGRAEALVELAPGKYCRIALGKTRHRIGSGLAHLVLTDDLGRFLRGETFPKTKGKLTFHF